jgi:hypothetical protein
LYAADGNLDAAEPRYALQQLRVGNDLLAVS